MITDTLGLIWGVVVGPANQTDGTAGQRVIEPLLGYLYRMKQAYKNGFKDWVEDAIIGLEVEISSCPPSEKGFAATSRNKATTFLPFSLAAKISA